MRTSSFRPAFETRYCFAAEYLVLGVSFFPSQLARRGRSLDVNSRCNLADVYVICQHLRLWLRVFRKRF